MVISDQQQTLKKPNVREEKEDLQVQDDSFLTTENGGRVGKKGIENAEITRVDLHAVHDGVFVDIQDGALSRGVQHHPAPW